MRLFTAAAFVAAIASVCAIPITPAAPALQRRAEQFRLEGLKEVSLCHLVSTAAANQSSLKSPQSLRSQRHCLQWSRNHTFPTFRTKYHRYSTIVTVTMMNRVPAILLRVLSRPHQSFRGLPAGRILSLPKSMPFFARMMRKEGNSLTKARSLSCVGQQV